MAFRFLATTAPVPPLNSNEIERYCEPSMEILWDDDKTKQLFEASAAMVEMVANGNFERDNIRTEVFTQALKTRLQGIKRNIPNPN